MQLEKRRHLQKISTYELLNQQHEIHHTRTIPISASFLGFLFRGFKQWNFSLKALIKTGSFMLVSTVFSFGNAV